MDLRSDLMTFLTRPLNLAYTGMIDVAFADELEVAGQLLADFLVVSGYILG